MLILNCFISWERENTIDSRAFAKKKLEISPEVVFRRHPNKVFFFIFEAEEKKKISLRGPRNKIPFPQSFLNEMSKKKSRISFSQLFFASFWETACYRSEMMNEFCKGWRGRLKLDGEEEREEKRESSEAGNWLRNECRWKHWNYVKPWIVMAFQASSFLCVSLLVRFLLHLGALHMLVFCLLCLKMLNCNLNQCLQWIFTRKTLCWSRIERVRWINVWKKLLKK